MARPKGSKNSTSDVEEISVQESVNDVPVDEKLTRATFTYHVPETKEDHLALHQCLKNCGVNGIGDLEVKASRL